MNVKPITLKKHLISHRRSLEDNVIEILLSLADAGTSISSMLRFNTLDTGGRSSVNHQGDTQHVMDVFSNDIIVRVLRAGTGCAGVLSEESHEPIEIDPSLNHIVVIDPLDGSSNVGVNVPTGTIFGVFKRRETSKSKTIETHEYMRPARELACAGYLLYGPSTVLILAFREHNITSSVSGFTLDPVTEQFILTHEDIRCPVTGNVCSINSMAEGDWNDETRAWYRDLVGNRTSTTRYAGTMVSDIHRILLKGGVFAYPLGSSNPRGKLRLAYEAGPIAYVFEQAGGVAHDGMGNRIVDIIPTSLHQRTPVFAGSVSEVVKVPGYLSR